MTVRLAQDRDQWRAFVEHGIKPMGTIKGEEFLDYLSDY
jgi:hypothetical protein